MSTKKREVIFGPRIVGAKIRARQAKEAQRAALRAADRRLLHRPWRARPLALLPTRVDLGRPTKSDDKVGESMTSVFHPGAKGLPVRDDPCRLNQPVRQNHGLVLNFEGD
jgi:hypothetical protein